VRLSLTGAAGIGKTTLARALAARFKAPLLGENFGGIVSAFNAEARPGDEVARVRRRANCRAACLDWLRQRESQYLAHPGFIEDRCAIDVLFRWLLENLSDADNGETQRMIELTRALLATTDFVVIPPLALTEQVQNEEGLVRVGSFSRLFRAQSLALGIAGQLLEPSRLIVIPDDRQTLEERMRFVLIRVAPDERGE
jgi:hypothetical protein